MPVCDVHSLISEREGTMLRDLAEILALTLFICAIGVWLI